MRASEIGIRIYSKSSGAKEIRNRTAGDQLYCPDLFPMQRLMESHRSLLNSRTLSAWAEIFDDAVAVAAMVDRLVHHAEVIGLEGDSYRLKGKGKEVLGSKSR